MCKQLICTLVAPAVLVLAVAASASPTPPRLHGTVGPGYTITLDENGKLLRTLRHGAYTLVIADRSHYHDFTIDGTGLPPTVITGDGFIGTKTVTLLLRRGTYEYYCAVHQPVMHGTFTVR